MDLRLFIAVELPESWSEALAATQAALRRRGLERLRWVRPEGIHLTLKFLGNVDERRVPELTEALTRAASGVSPFRLSLAGLGSFGPAARPRVVWVGVGGDLPALTRLWDAVETDVGNLGFPRERQRFAPHLTLARVPDDMPREVTGGIGATLGVISAPAAPPLAVTEVALMRSELGRGGARYTRLASVPLAENLPSGPRQTGPN